MPTGTQPLPSPLSRHIGVLISDAIANRGLSQVHVADSASMSPSQLSRVLTGKKVFTIDQLDSVCDAIGLDLVDVVAAADRATRRHNDGVIRAKFGVNSQTNDELAAASDSSNTTPDDRTDEGFF